MIHYILYNIHYIVYILHIVYSGRSGTYFPSQVDTFSNQLVNSAVINTFHVCFSLYDIQCTTYTLYNVQCTMYTIYCTVYSVYTAIYTPGELVSRESTCQLVAVGVTPHIDYLIK